MSAVTPQQQLSRLSDFLEKEGVRVLLSALIIISVLPDKVLPRAISSQLSMAFFCIFAFEFIVRVSVFVPSFKEGRAGYLDVVLLGFDLVATLSFLPVEMFYAPAKGLRVLRLFRLMRLLLLLRYWGAVGKEIWIILMKRKYQVLFAASVVVILTFVVGVLLSNIEDYRLSSGAAGEGFDYNDDGEVDESDSSFASILWWTFRQIQDPGNLVRHPGGGLVVILSILLTTGGLFIISFVIGIGTNVVEELVSSSRGRPIGLRGHSAILNITRHSYLLLNEIKRYYRKHLRKARIAVLGATRTRPDYLFSPELRSVRYRWGQHGDVQDFKKVDADKASRIILLGNPEDPASDATVVSQILSLRQLNPDAWLLAEVFDVYNLGAVAEAGGTRTIPIPVGKLVGLFLSHIVLFPGMEDVFREILTSRGQEIYTVIFGEGQVAPLPATVKARTFGQLHSYALDRYGVVLLGLLEASDQESDRWAGPYRPVLNPQPSLEIGGDAKGFIGLSPRFGRLRDFAQQFATGRIGVREPPPAPPGDLPAFGLCPGSSSLRHILICQFHQGLIDFIEQLAHFLGQVTLHVMVDDEREAARVEQMLREHSERLATLGLPVAGRFTTSGEGLAYGFGDASRPPVTVRIVVGDPTDERALVDPAVGSFTLRDMDAMVFTPQPGSQHNPDAKTALGMLKVSKLHRARPDLLKDSLRLVAEVDDPERGELLESGAMTSRRPSAECRAVSVLSRERIRNELLAQATFVPGVAPIYTELLSQPGQQLCRLVPDTNDGGGQLVFPELARALYDRDRLLILGVELRGQADGPGRLCLNPGPDDPGHRFRLADLVAISAIGDLARLEPSRASDQPP